jgi:hypothetical protein
MEAMSDDMIKQLQGEHTVISRVDILDGGDLAATLGTTIDGSVDIERRDIERSATLEIVDEDGTLTPSSAKDLLVPYGNEFRPWRGVVYPNGASELVALATLRITRANINWPRITLTGMDRAWIVQGAKFESAYTVAKGTNYIDAIAAMLIDRYPQIVINFPTTSSTTPLLVFEANSDPWAAAIQMTGALGMRLLFDSMGECTMEAEAVADEDSVVWEYVEGPDSLMLGTEREFDTEGVYNAAVVTGENTSNDAVVRAIAVDNDPASPTYYYGKFGKRAQFASSQFVADYGQANAYAQQLLQSKLGLSDSIRFTALVNPGHGINDVLYVKRPVMGIDDYHILDRINIPMRGGSPANASTRARQVALL